MRYMSHFPLQCAGLECLLEVHIGARCKNSSFTLISSCSHWQIKRDKRATLCSTDRQSAADELCTVMQRAHLEDPQHKFIQHIKMSPEPAIILYTDAQIQGFAHLLLSIAY